MTYLTNLRKLAEAATPGPWHIHVAGDEEIGIVRTIETERGLEVAIATTGDVSDEQEARNAAYFSRLSPDRVLAMLDVIEAAMAMRKPLPGAYDVCRAFDAALAAFEKEQRR